MNSQAKDSKLDCSLVKVRNRLARLISRSLTNRAVLDDSLSRNLAASFQESSFCF